jgi:D-alanyl-D-alanine carboxypeptidase (penicillin-binding protein 5/6)
MLAAMTQTLRRTPFGDTTRSANRRRRRFVLGFVVLVTVLVLGGATAIALRLRNADSRRVYLSTNGWPASGQGAYQLGSRAPAASPDERPVPIASLAKVMTALVVLNHLPLDGAAEGPALVVRPADVADTARRRSRDESVVTVQAGERLTERQAVVALLLPSANNVAVMLARKVSGSVTAFVGEMNSTARALGMHDTTYTDPSGFAPSTQSTAIDQLTLALHVAQDPTLTSIMSTRSARLPVAGAVHNTDTLLGSDGFMGMKTGSDDAAGGCFMFRSVRSVRGFNTDLIGVVLGQHGRHELTAGLYAAKQLVDRVAPSPAHP